MNIRSATLAASFVLACLVATGCNRAGSSLASEAQRKIAGQNLSLGNGSVGLPKAELTPQGDLLIAGNKVATTPEQHALLARHRQLLEQVASDGVAVGLQGANLAGKAIGSAISGALSGDTAGTKARIESEAGAIKSSARQLCDELPALLESQQKLAAALPEFRPYARMTEANVKDCHAD